MSYPKVRWAWSTIEECIQTIDTSKPLFADFETYNESKHYAGGFYGSIRLVQFMQEGWSEAKILDMRYGVNANRIEELADIVYTAYIVGQNFAYDYSVLQEHRGNKRHRIDLSKYEDLLILARELNPLQRADSLHGRFSLDDTYLYIIGFDPYEQIPYTKKEMQGSKWGKALTPDMLNYAAIDVFYLPELYKAMKAREEALLDSMVETQVKAYKVRKYNAHLAVDVGLLMQSTGMVLDYDKATDYFEQYNEQKQKAWYSLLASGLPETFNPASSPQVTKLTGLTDKTGKLSSNKETLKYAIHKDGNKLVQDIMDYRQGASRSGNVVKWMELVQDQGRVYGHFQPTTSTGRFSSSQENMQNFPRDSKVCFKAPDKAVLINFDYAQIELRTMCAITGDERMYEVFKSGGDIHSNTKDMCNIESRSIAKQVNFG